MVFSSALFLFLFLPVVLLLYYLLPKKCQNAILLIASILFYTWGEPRFILILLGSITLDYFIAKGIDKQKNKQQKKKLLILAIVLNVLLLGYFKYANFFIENVQQFYNWLGLTPFKWSEVALPIGISFVTFQKISYLVDVYRGDHPAQRRWDHLAMYILMFPQLIAGPIVRYKDIAQQLSDRRENENWDTRLNGLARFIIGLSKKVLIANVLATQVDLIFSTAPEQLATTTAWIGMVAYSMQIYFDFSGYSDMALGLGLMLGYRFPENFNFPYLSQSFSEFWKRWHISLGRWMMDYLYIPLGGNRKGKIRTLINLAIVFLISGLWHGAAWTFVAWGAYHGIFLILDKLGLQKGLQKLGRIPAILITCLLVMIGWVIFRADTLSYSTHYIARLFSFTSICDNILIDNRFIFTFTLSIGLAFLGIFHQIEGSVNNLFNTGHRRWQWITLSIIMILLYLADSCSLLSGDLNPFIYFRF